MISYPNRNVNNFFGENRKNQVVSGISVTSGAAGCSCAAGSASSHIRKPVYRKDAVVIDLDEAQLRNAEDEAPSAPAKKKIFAMPKGRKASVK